MNIYVLTSRKSGKVSVNIYFEKSEIEKYEWLLSENGWDTTTEVVVSHNGALVFSAEYTNMEILPIPECKKNPIKYGV